MEQFLLPLEIPGPVFAPLFAVALLAATLAWWLLRAQQRGPGLGDTPELDRYQLAYLRGGPMAMVESALIALLGAKRVARAGHGFALVAIPETVIEPRGYRGEAVEVRGEAVEEAVARALSSGNRTRPQLVAALDPESRKLQAGLVEGGWMFSPRQPWSQRHAAKLPLAIVLGFGLLKLGRGLTLHKPIGFLVLLLCVGGTVLAALPRLGRLTRRGEQMLAGARRRHDALLRTARTAPAQLSPGELSLAYAVAGVAIGGVSMSAPGAAMAATGCAAFASAACGSSGSGGGDSGGGGGDSGGGGGGGDSGGSCGGGGGCGGCGGCS